MAKTLVYPVIAVKICTGFLTDFFGLFDYRFSGKSLWSNSQYTLAEIVIQITSHFCIGK